MGKYSGFAQRESNQSHIGAKRNCKLILDGL